MTYLPSSATPRPMFDVHWFGASRRQVGGVPDSRYGWLDLPDGPCVVKAMDPELTAYNQTLPEQERKILLRLQALQAPVPALVDLGRPDWLVTRFAGLSVQRLEHAFADTGTDPRVVFPLAERLAVWVHLLRRLQPLAERGVWVIDLHEGNVVVPLTDGLQGQLRLHEPMLIDHAHTLEAGLNLQRPVWLNGKMAHIPPELHQALQQDQQALMAHFQAAGAAPPTSSRLSEQRDPLSRRLWAEYSAPQALQRLLDANELNAGQAMQYAVAAAMKGLLTNFVGAACRRPLQAVLSRMTDQHPARRYPSLDDAAAELDALMPPLPLASKHRYGPLRPADLQTPEQAQASVLMTGTARPADARTGHTRTAQDLAHTALPGDPVPSSAQPWRTAGPGAVKPARPSGVPAAWGWVAAGLGAALGVMLNVPW